MEPVPMMHHPKKGAVSGDVTLHSKPGEEPPAPPPPQPPPIAPQVTRDCLDMMFTYMNYDLFIAKAFYFFFFSAFGSLFPLIAVYFKQLGLNATQSGLLIGLRPFIEFFSAPFWGNIADRFKKAKLILLFSLFCWILFTLSLAFVKPPAHSCIVKNATHKVLEAPMFKRSVDVRLEPLYDIFDNSVAEFHPRLKRQAKTKTAGQSPYNLDHEDYDNKGEGQTAGLVTPPFSSIVYETKAVQETFVLLLLLVIIGEFFAAPAITLADAAVLGYLGSDCGNYGKQRMFGSLGWGLAMFFVGIALDHSTTFPGHPCPVQSPGEKNYTICFAVFSVLMAFAWLAATQFHLQLDTDFVDTIPLGNVIRKLRNRFLGIREPEPPAQVLVPEEKPKEPVKEAITLDKNDRLQISLDAETDMVTDAVKYKEDPGAHADTAQKWISVIKLFGNVHYGSFLFVSWYMGFGIGLVFTFLFWHLQDIGGSPTLFGMASVVNHISEIVAYFFSNKLITNLGHVRVLYVGLAGNVARFLYISWLPNPWWVLPFEFVQGLTHAAVWAACCSYITQATPYSKRSSAQGVLQGIHHGLGRGCGAIFGGVFVYAFGSELTFRGYGFFTMIIMAIFVGLNHFFPKPDLTGIDDTGGVPPGMMYEESTALAPCGVPLNPLGNSLSNSKLSDVDKGIAPAYGALKSTDQHLMPGNVNGAIPVGQDQERDSKNPFITPQKPYDQSSQPRYQDYGGRTDQDYGYQQQGHRRQQSGGGEVRDQPGYGYSVSQQQQPANQNYGYGINQQQQQPQQPQQQSQQQQQQREGYGYGQTANQVRRESREGREITKPRRQDSAGRTAGYEQGYMDSYNQQPNIAGAPQMARPRRVSGSRNPDEDQGFEGRRQTNRESGDVPTRDQGRDEPDFVRYDRLKDEARTGNRQPEDRYRRDDADRYPRPDPESRYPRREEEQSGRYPTRRQDSDQGRSRGQPQTRHDSGDYSMPLQTDPQTGRPVIPSGGFMRGGRGGGSSGGGY